MHEMSVAETIPDRFGHDIGPRLLDQAHTLKDVGHEVDALVESSNSRPKESQPVVRLRICNHSLVHRLRFRCSVGRQKRQLDVVEDEIWVGMVWAEAVDIQKNGAALVAQFDIPLMKPLREDFP